VAFPLQITLAEAVDVKVLVLVLIAVAMLAFASGSLLTPRPVTSSWLSPQVVAASHDAVPEEAVDAYGNEVTHAVAEYTLDAGGALYELHAPQVEIPHLGSPKS
jgi:hypothetical protein